MTALAQGAGADEIAFLAVADHLRAADAAKGAECRQQINRLENVGFALGVVAEQQMKAGRKINVQPRVVAEIAKSKVAQMHGRYILFFVGEVKTRVAESVAGAFRHHHQTDVTHVKRGMFLPLLGERAGVRASVKHKLFFA